MSKIQLFAILLRMRKKILILLAFCLALAVAAIGHIYYYQEEILFRKATLPEDYVFSFEEPFEELFLDTEEGARINALYFKTDTAGQKKEGKST